MRDIELLVTHKIEQVGLAVCLKSQVPPVLTPSLVHEIRHLQNILAEQYYDKPWNNIYYVVWYLCASKIPWNGLDFSFIHSKLTKQSDKELVNYIHEVFDLLFLNYVGLGFPLINCSIVTRPLKGMSQEFFWLNQINFFKKNNS